MKVYNSNKIIRAVKQNKKKFEMLKSISDEILKVREDKKQQAEFIDKIYTIVLKNLSNTKKKVNFDFDNNYSYSFMVNKTGIAIKHSYTKNADNIVKTNSFFKRLVEVKKHQKLFLKVISPKKRPVFKRFMEKVDLLKEEKPTAFKLETVIEWINNTKEVQELRISYNSTGISIHYSDEWIERITFNQLGFENYAVIEQLYNQFKRLLEMELKQNVKELSNIKKFLTDLDTKFSSYVKSVETLEELKK